MHNTEILSAEANFSLFTIHFSLLFRIFAAERAIWWLMPPDARESGESPELYLQL